MKKRRESLILILVIVIASLVTFAVLEFPLQKKAEDLEIPCLNEQCDDISLTEVAQEEIMFSPGEEPIDNYHYAVTDDLDLRDNVLVIYNENVNYGRDIAEYYANKRGISQTRICPVLLPPGEFASASELLGARKTIIENCICRAIYESIPEVDWPAPCDVSNIDSIARVSPITHLTIIKGIPSRLTETGWPDDYEEPSFDYYLSILIYRSGNLFAATETGDVDESSFSRESAHNERTYVRPINISLDRVTAYGRVEAMDKERTLELIDRTFDAEQDGFSGNFLLGIDLVCDASDPACRTANGYHSNLFKFWREVSSTDNPVCTNYVYPFICGDEAGVWDHNVCRGGFSVRGDIPGESGSGIPKVVNAGIYYGLEYQRNGHSAFDGFYNMLRWHKSQSDCVELCRDFQTQQEVDECRDNSQDYFKEINTNCVGVAPGFLGWQYRSYPVQYYGFWPPGWDNQAAGSYEKTPPAVLEGDSYQDSKFTDSQYLHFGESDSVDLPNCVLEDGTVIDCKERVAPHLFKSITFNPELSFSGTKTFTLRIRHRNLGTDNAFLNMGLYIIPSKKSSYSLPIQKLSLETATDSWQTDEFNFSITDDSVNVTSIYFFIYSSLSSISRAGVDIDGIELIEDSGRDVIDLTTGSFNGTYIGQTNSGDWASNVIDRLGGIAWWGSSSHFLTGGNAFKSVQVYDTAFLGAFFSGRSLGESLVATGTRAKSGIIYGDPLYRPSGVRISLNKEYTHECAQSEYGCFSESFPLNFTFCNKQLAFRYQNDGSSDVEIYINAFHGMRNLDSTSWQIAYCLDADVYSCDTNSGWVETESGNQSVFAFKINSTLMDFAGNLKEDHDIYVRLRVWNSGEESNELKDYLYLRYKYIEGSCEDDMDSDGLVNCYDNCVFVYNPNQNDIDGDGIGDLCDEDIDGDGKENPTDMCPTRACKVSEGCSVFYRGCPKPFNWSNFMNNLSTNISAILGKFYDVTLKLGIPENGSIEFNQNIAIGGLDFDKDVKIGKKYVSINTTSTPELNVSANITLFDFLPNIANIRILEEVEICRECSVLSYENRTLVFNVSHFTRYDVVWCGDGLCQAGEDCYSCSGDCGECSSGNEGRGGGGGDNRISPQPAQTNLSSTDENGSIPRNLTPEILNKPESVESTSSSMGWISLLIVGILVLVIGIVIIIRLKNQ